MRSTDSGAIPVFRDLVLLGAGHSHVAVLKQFGMRPMRGVRLTVITREVHTPYSGMLPGLIAGHYGFDETHIDMAPLARFAGARLYADAVIGLDLDARIVLCRGRPPVRFDLLSIDVGAIPALPDGAAEGDPEGAGLVPVKPISGFLVRWEALRARVLAAAGSVHIAVVGGGAGGVELTLALHHRLTGELRAAGGAADRLTVTLITRAPGILPGFPAAMRQRFQAILADRGIDVVLGEVCAVGPGRLTFRDALPLACDEVVWVTDAAAQAWLGASGLAVDARGFVEVDPCLRSLSHAQVFAAGDIASVVDHPRSKSGVFAVRQGKPLAENLRRALSGRRLLPFRPQRNALAIVTAGDKWAMAARDSWSAGSVGGRLVWRWKNWIDHRFMTAYRDLPTISARRSPPPGLAGAEPTQALAASEMHRGGGAARLGASVLERILGRLGTAPRSDVLIGLDAPDGAAVVAVPDGHVMVQSVDHFHAFIDDPYLFGRIAAVHCLSDLHAMGADPKTALTIATLPFGVEAKMEDDFFQMMTGAIEIFRDESVALVGGHSSEGAELSLGFVVTGTAEPARLLRKGRLLPGQLLVLTKPIGTGTLLVAAMRGKAKARWITAALGMMQMSNRRAVECLRRHGATACTDVTGFGLAGHVREMAVASGVGVQLDLDAIPVLDGAVETAAAGILSSAQEQNRRSGELALGQATPAVHPAYPLLFDPQIAGGLLAGIAPEDVASCLADLHAAGMGSAAIIGVVLPAEDADAGSIRLAEGSPVSAGPDDRTVRNLVPSIPQS
jgi:selenide,water dikinase